MKKISNATVIVIALLLLLVAPACQAGPWPERPVTLWVAFPPGGSTDQVARALAPRLAERLGQPVMVENRAGAAGTVAAAVLKRTAPDGYTFLVTSLGPLVIAPHLLREQMQYDPLRDFEPITVAVQSHNVLVVPAASPLRSVADVVAQLKAQPGAMSFASSGNGTSDHLTAELFWQQTATRGLHVPYKGGAAAQTDLMGGQVAASFQNINAVVQHIRAGRLRALGVTSATRSPVLPDVPTMAEAGVQNLEVTSWQAVVAPRGLPPAIRDRAHAAMVAVLNDPAVRDPLVAIGFELVANTPARFAAFQQAEYARWKRVIEAGNITVN